MRVRAAELFDAGRPCGAEANMAKLLAADASWEAANVALQTHGGFGFAEDYDVERKFRETRLYQVAPISTNLILSYIAEHVLGLPALVLMAAPLDGVTVVALEQAVAAPFATRQLADLGARVVKVERPGVGDFARAYDATVKGLSSHFVWLNRSKESLTLDLKRPEAREVVDRLIDRADVFVQNLAPGAADRLGMDAGTLRARRPRLVVCNVSGYGATGPYRDKKAYDLLVQAEAGLVSITGTPEQVVKSSISVADIAAGMYAYSGVLTALFRRERTGEGAAIEVSMLEGARRVDGLPALLHDVRRLAPRPGAAHGTPPSRLTAPFEGADGETVFLGLQNEREWVRFCAVVLERPGSRHRPALRRQREARRQPGRARGGDPRCLRVSDRGGHRGPARRGADRQRPHELRSAARRASPAPGPRPLARRAVERRAAPGPPCRRPPSTASTPAMDAVPEVGEHTDALLAELGYVPETVAAWRRAGIV